MDGNLRAHPISGLHVSQQLVAETSRLIAAMRAMERIASLVTGLAKGFGEKANESGGVHSIPFGARALNRMIHRGIRAK